MPIVGQETTAAAAKRKAGIDAPDQVRYINFYLPSENGGSRLSLGSVLMSKQNANQAKIIERLDAEGPDTLRSFVDKVLVAEYNPGKGDHVEKRFINIKMKSRQGHLSEIGFLVLEETNQRHVELILALDNDPEQAQHLLQGSDLDYRDALPKVHEYDF